MDRYTANLCEWNPVKHIVADSSDDPAENNGDCQNKATLSVGHNGMWHLCDSCAALPEFKRYRKRVRLKPASGGSCLILSSYRQTCPLCGYAVKPMVLHQCFVGDGRRK